MSRTSEDKAGEGKGWLMLAGAILLFPTLFFIVVFLPMWLGWTTPW